MKEDIKVAREIYRQGEDLEEDSKAKYRWERMSPVQVLREWPSFFRRFEKQKAKKL